MEDYKFYFNETTLFIEFKIPINEEIIKDSISKIQETFPNLKFKIVAIKNIIGYWSAFNFENKDSIYCGTMSIKVTKDNIKKYLQNEIKNSSN